MWMHWWAAAVVTSAGRDASFDDLSVIRATLSDGWSLTNANGSVTVPPNATQVPGHVHTDLLRAGLIPDPYFRFEDDGLAWVRNDTWVYTCTFGLPPQMLTRVGRLAIEFDGIDTVANISLNGHALASTANQHRRYRFDVTSVAKDAGNTLVVVLHPATAYADAAAESYPYDVGDETFIPQHLQHRTFVRKQQSDFGWDWGPALVPAGVWRPVRLVQWGAIILTDVVPLVSRAESGGGWVITVRVCYRGGSAAAGSVVTATLAGRAKASATIPAGGGGGGDGNGDDGLVVLTLTVDAGAVELWWPAGYGNQPLYNLTVTASSPSGGAVVDTASRSVGFREAAMVEEPVPDAANPGATFYARVNGVGVFAKGSNWIPADAFDNRCSDERLRRLLLSAVLANQNFIRVWGGGNYMRDSFWDLCDELGLLVWVDFMHGGGRSPRHAAHAAEWAAEVRDNVRRVAGHASIIMWAGNNEGVKAITSVVHGAPSKQWAGQPDAQGVAVANYAALFDDVVRRGVAAEDPARHFHASCPSNGFAIDDLALGLSVQRMGDPFSEAFGDTRHYDYTSYCLDSTKFPRGRFVSEFGWQSYPSLLTLEKVTTAEDLHVNSTWADHVQHHPNGNPQLVAQNAIFFDAPSSFADFVAQTQAVQALCIATQSRFYRAQRNVSSALTMGSLYWQLNDIWPAPSWASIEYGDSARWKVLHYHMKRAYAPLMLFADLSGVAVLPDGSVDVANATVAVQAVSDHLAPVRGLSVTTEVWDLSAGVVALSTHASVDVPALSVANVTAATPLSKVLGGSRGANSSVLVVTASGVTSTGVAVSAATELYLTPFKVMAFPRGGPEPVVNVALVAVGHDGGGAGASRGTASAAAATTLTLTVSASALVPMLTLDSVAVAGYFSDSGFLALPGRPATVTFTPWVSVPSVTTFLEELEVRSTARPNIAVHKSVAL